MADKKTLTAKEIGRKIVDLKIELLKNPTKKGSIKREIARLLTMKQALGVRNQVSGKKVVETLIKSVEDTK